MLAAQRPELVSRLLGGFWVQNDCVNEDLWINSCKKTFTIRRKEWIDVFASDVVQCPGPYYGAYFSFITEEMPLVHDQLHNVARRKTAGIIIRVPHDTYLDHSPVEQ